MRTVERGWIQLLIPFLCVLITAIMAIIALTVLLSGCRAMDSVSDHKVDSAYTKLFDGTIADGVVYVPRTLGKRRFQEAIREQLYFSVGQLQQLEASTDIGRLPIKILTVAQSEQRSDWLEIHYQVQFLVAWALKTRAPPVFQLVMPARIDLDKPETSEGFHNAFSDSCEAENVDASLMWHDFAPQSFFCPLRPLTQSPAKTPEVKIIEGQAVARIPMTLESSHRTTEGRKPEYDLIWSDDRLVVTAVFGKDVSGEESSDDEGIREFINTYNGLIEAYGEPVRSNIKPGVEVGSATPVIDLGFSIGSKKLDVIMILTDGAQSGDELFEKRFRASSQNSDLVIYSGHSDYGANIEALVALADFRAWQYQIWLIDSCISYSYMDNALRDRHAKLNPKSTAHKYIDIIANAMPAPWGVGKANNMNVITALVDGRKSYREILSGLDVSSRAVVWGEEDNSK